VRDRKELFERCEFEERHAKEAKVTDALERAARFHVFERPLFTKGLEKANSRKIVIRGRRYSELLRDLRKVKDIESRWILIARWLKNEGICEPEEFLPPPVLRRALKRVRSATTKLSPTKLHYWRLMTIWMPYFDSLFHDRSAVSKTHRRVEDELMKLGYSRDAVKFSRPRNEEEFSMRKRSSVQAVAGWLEERGPLRGAKHVSAGTLKNAYSDVSVALKEAESQDSSAQNDR
jgi:hypothetical protein